MEGKAFSTERGDSFTYRYRKTYIVVSGGNQSIPRTNFEKVWRFSAGKRFSRLRARAGSEIHRGDLVGPAPDGPSTKETKR